MDEPTRQTVLSEKDQFRFLKRLPWEKITIWAIFIFLLYLLQSFFTIIFLTFILSYISWNLVNYTVRRLNLHDPAGVWRRIFTVLVFLIFIALILGAGFLVGPRVVEQGNLLVKQLRVLIPARGNHAQSPELQARAVLADITDEGRREELRRSGEYDARLAELAGMIRRIRGTEGGGGNPGESDKAKPDGGPAVPPQDLRYHFEKFLESVMGKNKFEEFQQSPEYATTYSQLGANLQEFITTSIPSFVDFVGLALKKIINYVLDFLLSIVFSFLMVFSLPNIARKIPKLRESKIGRFYSEIAPSVVAFSQSMGRAFQGQAIIALCNTALTLVGMEILGIPNAAVLSVIVFVCSFIPVLGVFISSIPICLVAIQKGGIILAIEAAGLITLIHMFEAYLLNPRILGTVMHMHPLLVLVLLFTFEHFFGVWGLLLAVPAFHYLFYQVILGRKPDWLRAREKPDPPDREGEAPGETTTPGGPPAPPVGDHPMAPESGS
jgi:predicted PurR-regulated permease PerM